MKLNSMLQWLMGSLLIGVIASGSNAQSSAMVNNAPSALGIEDIIEILDLTRGKSVSIDEASGFAAHLIRRRCVEFTDDGTNNWVLKMAGSTKELMDEVERCQSILKSRTPIIRRVPLDRSQTHLMQRRLISGLIHMLIRKKDMESKKNTIIAAKEYMQRFEKDEEFIDPENDSMLRYLRGNLHKLEALAAKAGP